MYGNRQTVCLPCYICTLLLNCAVKQLKERSIYLIKILLSHTRVRSFRLNFGLFFYPFQFFFRNILFLCIMKGEDFMKILIVEDEPSLRELIQRSLEKERYVVEAAGDFNSALRKIEDYDYDCILLDIMLPDGSGLDLLERLKALHKRENVIIISAKDSLEDKVLGLELGADDYLPKPFHLAELNARIKSVIRRNQHDGEIDIRQGNVRIEPDKYRVFVNNQELELNRKEYDILLYFINRPGHLVNKNTLAESVWGDHIDQVDNFDFIYAQIKNLRKKLKDAGADLEIKAVYGFGYKMIVEEQKQ